MSRFQTNFSLNIYYLNILEKALYLQDFEKVKRKKSRAYSIQTFHW